MKQRSDTKPNRIEIDVIGDIAHVSIFDNIEEIETEDGTEFEYDHYLIKVTNQSKLKNMISNDIETWIEFAKENCNQ